MPGGDGTGPMGMGPMTGRGAGFCGGSGMPGFMNRGWGMGMGRGGGRGWRHWFHATGLTDWQRRAMGWPMPGAPDPQQELQLLEQQAKTLASTLEGLQTRIEQLKGHKATE